MTARWDLLDSVPYASDIANFYFTCYCEFEGEIYFGSYFWNNHFSTTDYGTLYKFNIGTGIISVVCTLPIVEYTPGDGVGQYLITSLAVFDNNLYLMSGSAIYGDDPQESKILGTRLYILNSTKDGITEVTDTPHEVGERKLIVFDGNLYSIDVWRNLPGMIPAPGRLYRLNGFIWDVVATWPDPVCWPEDIIVFEDELYVIDSANLYKWNEIDSFIFIANAPSFNLFDDSTLSYFNILHYPRTTLSINNSRLYATGNIENLASPGYYEGSIVKLNLAKDSFDIIGTYPLGGSWREGFISSVLYRNELLLTGTGQVGTYPVPGIIYKVNNSEDGIDFSCDFNKYKNGSVFDPNGECREYLPFIRINKLEFLYKITSSPNDAIKSIQCFNNTIYIVNLYSGLMAYSFTEGAVTPFTLLYNSTKPTYTVTYDGNGNTGGTVPIDSTVYKEKDIETVIVLRNTGNLVKVGYTFIGWNTAANGSGTSYTGGTVFIISSASIILYAQWTLNATYTITYDGNLNTGGSIPIDSNNYISGATATIIDNVNNLTRTGRTFVGWNTAAGGGGTNYAPRSTFAISANLLLYAKWTASTTYTVTYVAYVPTGPITGSVPVDKIKYTSGSTVTVMQNVGNLFISNSSILIGWSKTPSSTTIYAPGTTFAMSSSNVTLYSRFITNENWNSWSDGTYVYVAAGYQGLYAFDITTGIMVGYVNASYTNRCTGVWSDGINVFTADTITGGFSGVRVWSINPINPPSTFFSVVGSIDIGTGISTNNIRPYGAYFIVCRYNGLYAYSYNAGVFTPLGNIDPGGESLDIFILDNTYILVANGADGTRAYTFNGSTFTQVGYQAKEDGGSAYSVYSDGTNVFVAEGNSLRVFELDLIGPNLIIPIERISNPVSYNSVSGDGNCIFIGNGTFYISDLLTYKFIPDERVIFPNVESDPENVMVGNPTFSILYNHPQYSILTFSIPQPILEPNSLVFVPEGINPEIYEDGIILVTKIDDSNWYVKTENITFLPTDVGPTEIYSIWQFPTNPRYRAVISELFLSLGIDYTENYSGKIFDVHGTEFSTIDLTATYLDSDTVLHSCSIELGYSNVLARITIPPESSFGTGTLTLTNRFSSSDSIELILPPLVIDSVVFNSEKVYDVYGSKFGTSGLIATYLDSGSTLHSCQITPDYDNYYAQITIPLEALVGMGTLTLTNSENSSDNEPLELPKFLHIESADIVTGRTYDIAGIWFGTHDLVALFTDVNNDEYACSIESGYTEIYAQITIPLEAKHGVGSLKLINSDLSEDSIEIEIIPIISGKIVYNTLTYNYGTGNLNFHETEITQVNCKENTNPEFKDESIGINLLE
jgi:uncharacterized repeat protein (TIGR02543 family)